MKKTFLQKIAFAYAIAFFLIFALNYVPAIHDAEGFMFGLFKLDAIDDFVHIASAIWALAAGLVSLRQSKIYFMVFGAIYTADGILCTLTGQCLLDFTIFTQSNQIALIEGSNFVARLLPNVPHLLVGGLAIFLGYIWSKRESAQAVAATV